MKKEVTYLVLCLFLFFLFKLFYSNATLENLQWLLIPINYLFEGFTASVGEYEEGIGYIHSSYNMVIGKSCSGGNFLMICFLMTLFCLNRFSRFNKWLAIPVSFVFSYLVTIFANVSRIISFIYLSGWIVTPESPFFRLLHLGWGIFVYLTILILFYNLLHLLFKTPAPYEEPA